MKKNVWMFIIIPFVGWLLAGCTQNRLPESKTILPQATSETPTTTVPVDLSQKIPTNSTVITELDKVENTNHFTLHYPEGEQASASYLGIVLEENLERICADLGHSPGRKIEVFNYSDLDRFHKAIGYPEAPEWVIAKGGIGRIDMVSVREIASDYAYKVIVHELVHVVQGEINPDAPMWMIEGLGLFEAGQSEGVRERVEKGIQAGNIPRLNSLETVDTEEAFVQAGGYEYGYTVVEFVVQTYGQDILPEWVKTPRDYERVFGESAETFERQWLDYLIGHYD